jgi:predicted helicase
MNDPSARSITPGQAAPASSSPTGTCKWIGGSGLITKPVFDALFDGHEFAASNPVSRVMQTMLAQLGDAGLGAETAHLEAFYASVRVRAAEVTTPEGKQQVIADLYERFFKIGFAKQADALGIVYTPTEIVNFILRAADHASREAFDRGLTDKGVYLLDPFTGTGTFITRLLQSGLICAEDLARKYSDELFANEIMLLAYYIAAVNIESTYHALTGASYTPFQGIVLADTFQITEPATPWTRSCSRRTTTASCASWPPRSTSSSGTRPTPSDRPRPTTSTPTSPTRPSTAASPPPTPRAPRHS